MTAALIFVAAIAADSATYLLMGTNHEANPIVAAAGPELARAVRWVALVVALVALSRLPRFRRPMLLAGALAGVVGAWSNVLVLASVR